MEESLTHKMVQEVEISEIVWSSTLILQMRNLISIEVRSCIRGRMVNKRQSKDEYSHLGMLDFVYSLCFICVLKYSS